MPYRVDQIDETYPVAGVDNESQGFRDNFSAIKDTLNQSKQDIEDLQESRIDKNEPEQSFNNNTLTDINLGNVSHNSFNLSGVNNSNAGGQPIDYSNGIYQIFSLNRPGSTQSSPQILRFENWPELGRIGKIRIQVSSQLGTTQHFQFVYPNGLNFFYDKTWPTLVGGQAAQTVLSVNGQDAKVFEFWTYDGGANIYAAYLGVYSEVPVPAEVVPLANIGSIGNVDTTTVEPEDGQVLKFNVASSKWVPGNDNNTVVASLAELTTDVSVSAVEDGQILKYVESTEKWTASNNISSLAELTTDVSISSTPLDGQVLKYNATSSKWEAAADNNTVVTSLSGLSTDVVIASPQNNQVIKYNGTSNKWENVLFDEKIVTHVVRIVENGSGTQEVFEIDGNQIKTLSGAVNYINFEVGNKYVFDLSDSSNSTGRLKFSTTPDTSVPASITPYTTGVTEFGTAGTAGARTEIVITENTPDILYIYGDELPGGLDTSNLGGSVAIQKIYKTLFTGSENLINNVPADLKRSVSVINSMSAEISTLENGVNGQTKTLIMQQDGGSMVVTVSNAGWKTSGTGTVTLDAIGKSCVLQFINGKWFCVGNNGAAFA